VLSRVGETWAHSEKIYGTLRSRRFGDFLQIKNMGTIGGNLCNASPAADSAPPLIAFGAKVKLVEAEKERVVPLEDFFVGNGVTCLSPKEILMEAQVPEPSGPMGSAFIKWGGSRLT